MIDSTLSRCLLAKEACFETTLFAFLYFVIHMSHKIAVIEPVKQPALLF